MDERAPHTELVVTLPPLPEPPTAQSPLGAVRYLIALGAPVFRRIRAERAIRRLLIDDQRKLDLVLRDLGKSIRELSPSLPVVKEEIALISEQEARRSTAEQSKVAAAENLRERAEGLSALSKRIEPELAQLQEAAAAATEELAKLRDAEARAIAERDDIDRRIKEAEARGADADALALRAEKLHEDQGGGDTAVTEARLSAEAARTQAASFVAERDHRQEQVWKITGPLRELEASLAAMQRQISERNAQLAQEAEALLAAQSATDSQIASAEQELKAAKAEISQRLVAVGTLANLHRTTDPRMGPLYAQIDAFRNAITAHESRISKLQAERSGFDRRVVNVALLTLGIVAIVGIFGAFGFVITLARRYTTKGG